MQVSIKIEKNIYFDIFDMNILKKKTIIYCWCAIMENFLESIFLTNYTITKKYLQKKQQIKS